MRGKADYYPVVQNQNPCWLSSRRRTALIRSVTKRPRRDTRSGRMSALLTRQKVRHGIPTPCLHPPGAHPRTASSRCEPWAGRPSTVRISESAEGRQPPPRYKGHSHHEERSHDSDETPIASAHDFPQCSGEPPSPQPCTSIQFGAGGAIQQQPAATPAGWIAAGTSYG
jgi:hypothetical protein